MKGKRPRRVIIMGAGGRDFHNFNVFFRGNPDYDVAAFTATQIPFIEARTYPPSIAGGLYPKGIPIYPEVRLSELILTLKADVVVFSYSDVSHEYVMHKASLVSALGADFMLLGPDSTMLKSSLPVISVCAVRTGSGKSPVTRKLLGILKALGKRPVAIRHPMAYCDFEKQRAQRFSSLEDLDTFSCTVEEREEYEPIVEQGFVVHAGVDYGLVLKEAEKEADVIVWDGGNNDFPFVRPDLEVVVADALRPGHTLSYFPGETNFRRADIIVVNKVSESSLEGLEEISRMAGEVNPGAKVIATGSPVRISAASPGAPRSLKGSTVLVIEDGPTVTHGGMPFGAGMVASKAAGARFVSPVPYAAGTLKEAFTKYPHLKYALPSLGYSPEQLKDLEATIDATPCDAVVYATPVNLVRLIRIKKPAYRVTYGIREIGRPTLSTIVRTFLEGRG
jgi:predicted GTPase